MAQGSSLHTKLDRLSLKDRESSPESSSDSDRSDITYAIQPCTSRWFAATKGAVKFDGDHNLDVLQYLPIVVDMDSLDDPCTSACSAGWKDAFEVETPEDIGQFIEAISNAITVRVTEQRYPKALRDKYRQCLLHGGYPDALKREQLEKTKQELQVSRRQLHDLDLAHFGQNVPLWYLSEIVSKACMFVDAVTLYLQRQGDIREYGVTELFVAFAAVAGLNFSNAQSVTKRTMKVLGVDVISEADVRAYAGYLTRVDERGRTLSANSDDVKVVAIAEVKAAPPNEDWPKSIEPLCGQLLGELILEMPYSAKKEMLVGFAVHSTKVRVCLLDLPIAAQQFIQQHVDKPEKFDVGALEFELKGTLYWTTEMDLMIPEDRLRLWKIMMKLTLQ